MAKTPARSSEGGAPEWMVSYADMITIVLAFFVVLYATTSGSGKNDKGHAPNDSKIVSKDDTPGFEKKPIGVLEEQDEQLKEVFRSLYDRFGKNWTIANCWIGGPTALKGNMSIGSMTKNGDKKAKGLGGNTTGDNSINVVVTKPGDFVVPGGRIYFNEFSAELNDAEKNNLRIVSEELAGKSQKIEIRGHTSRQRLPKDSPYRDHFDLAYARCRTVSEFLESHGVDPGRIRLAVAADNEPAYPVNKLGFGERNSRVEIRLLNEWLNGKDKE
jgi:chemotaxis protein MotB